MSKKGNPKYWLALGIAENDVKKYEKAVQNFIFLLQQ